MDGKSPVGSFWDHLEVLRWVIIRIVGAVAVMACVAFLWKEGLFSVVLAPTKSDFITYRWMGAEPFSLQLVNTQLAEQFMTHLKTAFYAGFVVTSPYVLYQLFGFVAPALYDKERRYVVRALGWTYVMFIIGSLVNYFVVFPLTVRFLGTYQVSEEVANMLTLQSYMDAFFMMAIVLGLVFELPVLCACLGKMGVLTAQMMRQYRRHAIVAILIAAAIITPTVDMFTLIVVSLPIWLLYELSIFVVK
ncbi:MAG: twin-arginine translocase subunit TatC [Prevotella sp.]|nr:twin-arginine translocase subunit TatC [Prevotella sp.]